MQWWQNLNSKIWTKFTYCSPLVLKVINLYKQDNVRIAFRSTNAIYNFRKPKINNNVDGYIKSGIYQNTCATCKLYFGQTSGSLKQR